MFTYSHANTPLGQSERAYYPTGSYFINEDVFVEYPVRVISVAVLVAIV